MPQSEANARFHPPINKLNKCDISMWVYFQALLKMEIQHKLQHGKSRRYYAGSQTAQSQRQYQIYTRKVVNSAEAEREKGRLPGAGEGGMRSYCFSNTETVSGTA